jgi:DNA-binding IclR family transcriptional regulator
MPWAEVIELHNHGWFCKFTPHTKIDLKAIEKESGAVRRRGFAVSNEEHLLGARAVAAPILGGDSRLMATLGIGLPVTLFPKAKITELAASVRFAARAISSQLGWKSVERPTFEIRDLDLPNTMGGQKRNAAGTG